MTTQSEESQMPTEAVGENPISPTAPDMPADQPLPGQPGSPPPQADRPKPDLAWMSVPTQRGMRAKPGPDGLRIGDVDTGDYAYVPDRWPHQNDMPRGSHPISVPIASASYSLYDKTDVWSDNAAELYEDAIRDRWASATDIPWASLVELPEIQERAICQICTEISERSLLISQTLSGWLEKISYGFYEIKSFLGTQIYDTARHTEAFRKRALANGGGLGVGSPAIFHRAITSSLQFTEMVLAQDILLDTYLTVVLQALERVAPSDAERTLFRLTRRDLKRHMDYGIGHVFFALGRLPNMHQQVQTWLSRSEMLLIADTRLDTPWNEALILLLGDTPAQGREALEELRRTFVAAYLNRLADARVYNRAERLQPELKRYLPEGYATPMSTSMRPTLPDPLVTA
jgi:hypothetical protein